MEIRIKNLGPVKEASIDLSKNLILITGQNNTGKTWVTYSLFGVFYYGQKLIRDLLNQNPDAFVNQNNTQTIDILALFQQIKPTNDEQTDIMIDASSIIKEVFSNTNGIFADSELNVVFNKNDFENMLLDFTFTAQVIVNKKIKILLTKKSKDKNIGIEYYDIDSSAKTEVKLPTHIITDILAEKITHLLFPKPYIAPAERNAINIFNKELSIKRNVIVDQLIELGGKDNKTYDNPFEYLNRRATRYPLPIRVNLNIADDYDQIAKQQTEFATLADYIEKIFLKGNIKFNKNDELEFIPKNAKSKKIDIQITSSTVKSLSNLVIYFRHLAKQGDCIIIDEPELNLHPDNQVGMMRFLGKLINKGFKVIVSTHSDYIIRELNNLIMMSNINDDAETAGLTKKYNYDGDEFIDHQKIAAYLFHYPKENSRKVRVELIPIEQDGLEIKTIDNVIVDLNNQALDLIDSLGEYNG